MIRRCLADNTVMGKVTKIIITAVSVIIFLFLYSVVIGVTESEGGGMLGLILLAGLIGGLRSIWKKENNDKYNHSEQ